VVDVDLVVQAKKLAHFDNAIDQQLLLALRPLANSFSTVSYQY
jgi:hypothetical protein